MQSVMYIIYTQRDINTQALLNHSLVWYYGQVGIKGRKEAVNCKVKIPLKVYNSELQMLTLLCELV